AQSAEYNQPEYAIDFRGLAQRYDHREVDDHYEQPRALFRLMTPEQREELLDNMAASASGAQRRFQERWLGILLKCDEEYAAGFAKRLGLPMPTTAAAR
ncbi:MAG: catalase, partial [Dehalococcoidia bacterium]|nr:catalase [Dehalococcoidia bacterium]